MKARTEAAVYIGRPASRAASSFSRVWSRSATISSDGLITSWGSTSHAGNNKVCSSPAKLARSSYTASASPRFAVRISRLKPIRRAACNAANVLHAPHTPETSTSPRGAALYARVMESSMFKSGSCMRMVVPGAETKIIQGKHGGII